MNPFFIVVGIWILAASIILLGGLVGLALRKLMRRPLRPATVMPGLGGNGFSDGVYYGICFVRYWTAFLFAGAVAGILLYLVSGRVFLPEADLGLRLSKGFMNGFFYVGVVWGPGLSLVLCFVRGHRLANQATGGGRDPESEPAKEIA